MDRPGGTVLLIPRGSAPGGPLNAGPLSGSGGVLELSAIHFHDSRLIRVVEVAETHDLLFEVEYPVDWDNNVFEPRTIAFLDVLNYRIEEGPCVGAPTLLDAYDNGSVFVTWLGVLFAEGLTPPDNEPGSTYRSVTLQTNNGTRSLLFKEVELRPSGAAA